jgi:hypothetical protein
MPLNIRKLKMNTPDFKNLAQRFDKAVAELAKAAAAYRDNARKEGNRLRADSAGKDGDVVDAAYRDSAVLFRHDKHLADVIRSTAPLGKVLGLNSARKPSLADIIDPPEPEPIAEGPDAPIGLEAFLLPAAAK